MVNPKYTRDEVVSALRDWEYVVQDAARHLIEQEPYRDFSKGAAGGNDLFAMDEEEPVVAPARTAAAAPASAAVAPPPGFEATKPLTEMGRAMASAPAGKKPVAVLPNAPLVKSEFAFDTPSPDDVVLAKRQPTATQKAPVVAKVAPAVRAAAAEPAKPKTDSPGANPLKTSSGGLNKSSGGVNSLKASTGGTGALAKVSTAVIRAEKRTKQVVDEIARESAKSKERLNMVVIGHVDAGKSTLMGHLLHLLGTVDDRAMHKHKSMSEREGKGSFAFAWVMDASEEERKRGVTIDVGQAHFETRTKSVTLLDAPGHLDFVPNMIIGAAQAEVALLVVDSTPNNFESGFSAGGQTKEHALLARSLGVRQMVVVVNKLDAVGWSQERFETVRDLVSSYLTKAVGFRAAQLQFVPCSGHKGINVVDCTEPALSRWYTGPTLMGCIDAFTAGAEKDVRKPLRFYVTEVLGRGEAGISGMGLAGKVEAGFVAVGDQLLLMPLRQLVTVKSLKLQNGTTPQWARDGDSLEMGVAGQEDSVFGVGDILCDPQHPIPVVRKFRAKLVVFQPPRPILKGDSMILHMHSISAQCHVSRLRSIVDKSGNVTQKKPRMLPHKCTAIVDVRLDRPLCMDVFEESAQFGRFLLRTNSKSAAAGIVTSLLTLANEDDAAATVDDAESNNNDDK